MVRTLALTLAVAGLLLVAGSIVSTRDVSAAHKGSTPTCSTTLGIANHGEHVISDYVIGADGTGPGGGEGAAVPGAPGAHGHLANGIAPGASFCLTESQSPGNHFGP